MTSPKRCVGLKHFPAAAAAHPHFCADVLDYDHQRQCDYRRPKCRKPKHGSGLRVGSDPQRIVIRRTGDQPGTEAFEKSLQGVTFLLCHFELRPAGKVIIDWNSYFQLRE